MEKGHAMSTEATDWPAHWVAPEVGENPFQRHPLRRYDFAWNRLATLTGPHLDVGFETGEFICGFARSTSRPCVAVDPAPQWVQRLPGICPEVEVRQIGIRGPLPFADARFESASLLDVLEHVPAEADLLAELYRVLRPGGRLVLTVPADHAFSILDPDNLKFRAPRLHRLLWSRRFGADLYHRRFIDTSDEMVGDFSLGKREHTNYEQAALAELLGQAGFRLLELSSANLFWRWLQVAGLGAPRRWQPAFDRIILRDGLRFTGSPGSGFWRRANLFVVAERPT
jgi:SAM-dependent methyltransferase